MKNRTEYIVEGQRVELKKPPTTDFQYAVMAGYLNGWSIKQIAEDTGSTPGSVKVTAHHLGIQKGNRVRTERIMRNGVSLPGPVWSHPDNQPQEAAA